MEVVKIVFILMFLSVEGIYIFLLHRNYKKTAKEKDALLKIIGKTAEQGLNAKAENLDKKIKLDKIAKLTDEFKALYNGQTEEELEAYNKLTITEKDGNFILYRKQCYYGGCLFDAKIFDNKSEALREGSVITLLNEITKTESASYSAVHVNYECPEYKECSGIE